MTVRVPALSDCGAILAVAAMNRLSRQQKKDLDNFRAVTGSNERVAMEALKNASWNLQRSLDAYFNNNNTRAPVRSTPKVTKKGIERLWDKYKNSDGESMSADGVSRFCDDLGVDPSDISLLVFSYYCNAEHMGTFTAQEFFAGLTKLDCDSIEKLRERLVELPAEMDADVMFRKVYEFAFLFAREAGIKFVEKNMAIALWKLMLTGNRQWELLPDWCSFLESKDMIAIQRDTWDQVLDFAWTVRADFSNFDPNGAWPYLIDEFVEHMCKTRGISLSSQSESH